MWVDIDDLRAAIMDLMRETEEKLDGEVDLYKRATLTGKLTGYSEVATILFRECTESKSRNISEF